jgi:tRNA threonylcarbamoyladenosine biosynthesis protein TsaB
VNVLGFDTSPAAISACVLRTDGRAFEREPAPGALTAAPTHARELMPAIGELMERAELGFGELDAVAVGVGPGGFTGLRIGVATARGLAHAQGIGLRPVSSLTALAAGIEAPLRLPVIDAKRGEVFCALFEDLPPPEEPPPDAPTPWPRAERWRPLVARPDEVAARVRDGGIAPVAAGDGSIRFRRVLEQAAIRVEPDSSRAHVVRALNVCRLAREVVPVAPEAVVPEYLRVPDAKPT